MTRIEASVMIDRPVGDVWKFVTNLSNAAICFPNTVEIRQTSPGPLGLGATFSHQYLKRTITGRMIEYEPNRKFTNLATSGPIRGSKFSYSMEEIEGKTRLSLTIDLELSGLYRLAAPFMMGRSVKEGKAEAESRVESVKRSLESGASYKVVRPAR